MLNTRPIPVLLLTMTLTCGITMSCDRVQLPAENIVASVNGMPITQEDITFASRGVSGGHQQGPAVDKAAVLDGLIVQELASQRAVKLGLDQDTGYQSELRAMEVQVNAFKRKKLSEMFLQRELQQKSEVSDAEVQQYFNENAARLGTEINVWQILSRNEHTIKKIQAELAQGLPFDKVAAMQFPNLSTSAKKPWELGYLHWSQVPEVWSSVYGMKIGETSGIISGTNHRYWIIKLIDKRENKDFTFEQIKPAIIEILQNEKTTKLRAKTMQQLRDDARIVYVNENREPAKNQSP